MNALLPALMLIIKPIGLTLWGWIVSYLTGGDGLKVILKSTLENIVSKYELRAKETPDPKDDEDAKMYRSWLEQLKKTMESKEII